MHSGVSETSRHRPAAWQLMEVYLSRLSQFMKLIDQDAFERSLQLLCDAYEADSCIFVAGNGGSSATAAHWVNDMHQMSLRSGRRGIRALSLGDNLPLLTAIANDEGYSQVFRRQLENHLRPGDVLVLISVSGNSANLICAAELAREKGMTTIGLLGWDGGLLAQLATEALIVPAPVGEYPVVESAHSVLCDIFTQAVISRPAAPAR
jgi:D-sedoheptulose 7-phosphate isomerase